MPVEVKPYDLPDAALFGGTGNGMLVWQPAETVIVLGQSNTPEKSLVLENVGSDRIPVTKRPTGGETVILTPRMAVITVAREFREMVRSKEFFTEVNAMILDMLSDLGVKNYGTRGISDITIGNRKILGSSITAARAGWSITRYLILARTRQSLKGISGTPHANLITASTVHTVSL